jgi:hypothetical protein
VTAVLHGNAITGEGPCETLTCGQSGPPDELGPSAATGELQVLGGDWTQSIVSNADAPQTQTLSFDFPVSLYWSEESQVEYFNFGLTLIASATAIPGIFSEADFGNTAWVSSIRAVSAAGCDLADAGCDVTALAQQGGVRVASGATHGGFATPITTTAPEPGTWALLGTGLLGLGGVAARR